jgi:hypothetical protein
LKTPPKIYARVLENILVAIKVKLIFERFGINLPKQPQQTNKQTNKQTAQKYLWTLKTGLSQKIVQIG